MTQVTLFMDVTTEDILIELEKASEKYTGLHVDMENKEERKFVKDKAYDIQQLLAKLNRSRIDKSKAFKVEVEKEALNIKERLEIANLPFTLLIDAHKAERAQILADEKAVIAAKELAIQIEVDHEDALQYNKVHAFEKAEAVRLQNERDEQMKAEAAKLAVIAEQNKVKYEEEAKELAEAKRLSNQAHVTSIKTAVKESLIQFAGLSEKDAINAVKAIVANKITHTAINF